MKKTDWFLGVIVSIACIAAILITSIEAAAYSNYDYYEKEYEKYQITDDLPMEMDDIMDVTKEMMSYLRGNREDLVIYTTIDGQENVEFFNDQDKAHMADVRNLFLWGLRIRWICLGIIIVCIAILIMKKTNWKYLLPRSYQIALVITAAATGIAGYAFSRDFTAAFIKFHEIFFTNDLWIFDPNTDYMINMLPEGFFSDMVARIGTMFIGGIAILFVISAAASRMTNKQT
ncbi:MAG: TIGR01906 family membrane protein [Hespellia sp.]|nr:TIGR01906 family membrane protein [Hespellia sp.]